jgi:hypothetical protein
MEAEDIVGIHYHAATGEDTEDLASVIVRSLVCGLVRAL